VVFVLEDDAQAAPDRRLARLPKPAGDDHRFANTADVVAAIGHILGLGQLAGSITSYFSCPIPRSKSISALFD